MTRRRKRDNLARRRYRLALALALATAATQAGAQSNCDHHDKIVARLAAGYGETRQAIALTSGGHVIEVFASQETGTWTITVTAPGGLTCLVSAGEAYQAIAQAVPGEEM